MKGRRLTAVHYRRPLWPPRRVDAAPQSEMVRARRSTEGTGRSRLSAALPRVCAVAGDQHPFRGWRSTVPVNCACLERSSHISWLSGSQKDKTLATSWSRHAVAGAGAAE